MAISRRVRGTRTPAPAGSVLGRKRGPTGQGDTGFIDAATLGRALVSTGVVPAPGSSGNNFVLGATTITVNGSTYATVTNLTLSGGGISVSESATAGKLEQSPGLSIVSTSSNFFGMAITPTGTIGSGTFIELDAFGTVSSGFIEGVTARGTPNAPTAVVSGDYVFGGFVAKGYDGASYIRGAEYAALVSGTVSTGIVPMKHAMRTMNSGGTYDIRLVIYPSGGTYIGTGGGSDPGANNLQLKGELILSGATSGTIAMQAAAVAGSNTITWPAGTTDFSGTGGTSQVVKQTSAGGAFTVGQLAYSDLSGTPTDYLLLCNGDVPVGILCTPAGEPIYTPGVPS